MLRIGIVGTENSHADRFVRYLNVEQRRPDARIVALAGGQTEKNDTLAAQGQVAVVDTLVDIADEIDAALVCHRLGGKHREHAVPLLAAGKHVFVDKPTATTVGDVEEMIEAAHAGGSVLASWSVVRHAPGVQQLRAVAADLAPAVVTVVGPADPQDQRDGLFFYGPHVVETAFEVLGNPGQHGELVVRAGRDVVTAITEVDGTQLVLTFVRAGRGVSVPWRASVAGPAGQAMTEITTDAFDDGLGLDRFLDAALAGRPQAHRDQLIPPVSLLSAITDQLTAHDDPRVRSRRA